MNFAVVVEPAPALAAELGARKARARLRWPDAPFLSHPPHATLLAGVFEPAQEWLGALTNALQDVRAFNIESSTVITFPDDPAPGSITVAFDVAESRELRELQLSVAGVLARFRVPGAADTLAAQHRRSDAIASARQFGFPWVGAHWRPHFTVGSLPLRPDSPLLAEFLVSMPRVQTRVDHVAVWGVAGDTHSTIARLPFRAG